jgi:hypothetical protein
VRAVVIAALVVVPIAACSQPVAPASGNESTRQTMSMSATESAPSEGEESWRYWCEEGACFPAKDVEFGSHRQGTVFDVLPLDFRPTSNDCPYEPDESCEHRGEDGIVYYLVNTPVFNKRVVIAGPPQRGLPYGLSGAETPEQALAHMRTRYDYPFEPITPEDGVHLVTVAGSLKNERNFVFWLYLTFSPEGRFLEIALQGPPTV